MAKHTRTLMSREAALEEVRAIYAELEQRPVERDCMRRTECCQFKLTGKTPYVTAGEALHTVEALRASGPVKIRDKEDGSCPLLDGRTGKCEAYESRPFSCRTHFCVAAGGPYARREVVDLIRRLEDVDFALGGCGAQTLPVALRSAASVPVTGGKVLSKPMPRGRTRG